MEAKRLLSDELYPATPLLSYGSPTEPAIPSFQTLYLAALDNRFQRKARTMFTSLILGSIAYFVKKYRGRAAVKTQVIPPPANDHTTLL